MTVGVVVVVDVGRWCVAEEFFVGVFSVLWEFILGRLPQELMLTGFLPLASDIH